MKNKKEMLKNIVIGGLIVFNIMTIMYSLFATMVVGKMINENKKLNLNINNEKSVLINTYEIEVKNKLLKSVDIIINELTEIQSKGSINNNNKKVIGDELKKLSDISDSRKTMGGLVYPSVENAHIYNLVTDICHSIEKFNVYLAYGLDENSTSAIKCATEEITNITKLINEIDSLK